MVTRDRLYSADDLWDISHANDEQRYELDEGELIEMSPVGDIHGVLVTWLAYLFLVFVDPNQLGRVTTETGYILFQDRNTVRAPDIAFVAKANVKPLTGKYYPMAPDLAVEVVSPTDSADQLRRKVRQYLRAGTRLVWVVYPGERSVDVFRPGRRSESYEEGDILEGEDVLPGWTLAVKDIFKKLDE
ncbi:MAG TPA: Uma2 family endonuclease [Aggregatilineales bacterium]|nr:Uma2 family endonuclease [Aggregatilineales bacterium]